MAIQKFTESALANLTLTDAVIADNSIDIEKLSNVNLNIAPEVLEIQVSAPAAGQDTAWLWTWEQSTLPYARRTITNSPEVQVPLYKQGTYTVNNYAAYETFDSMTQTHSLYLKWIDGAGTDNLVSWAVNASNNPNTDSHPDINGGASTQVQRINISVPSTITLPTLTAPSVSYSVSNNGNGAYTFSGSASGDNPNIGPFYRGGTYTFNVNATGHPFYLTTDNGTNFSAGTYFGEYTSGVTGSRTDSGTITFTVPSNAPDTLYYQCGNHSVMRGAITIKDLAVETNNNGNYIVYFQHTQEGHKTPVELRPIPSLVNQMCLVYDSSSGQFVPQDLATYVENTPSFENKIREVAGTAELVVEDGSAVVAKVNVYDDSTYLPLTGNNAGDQAFATDTNILYIWDGSAWQQAGTTNTDDLIEGSNNLFYTDSRVDSRIALVVDAAPASLDTLNELAAALNDDANFGTTVTNSLAGKAELAGANFTGDMSVDTDTFFVDTSSNLVGIRTNAPAYPLDVRGNVSVGDGTTPEQDIRFHSLNGDWQVGSNDGGNGTNNNHFYFYQDTYRLTIQNGTGNVGIGLANPNSLLHIKKTNGDAKLTLETNESYDSYINFSGATSEASIGYEPASNTLRFANAADGVTSAVRMTIDNSGRVGIGTEIPAGRFEVVGSQGSNWAGRFENTNANGYGLLAITAGTDAADKVFELRTGTTSTVMLVDGTGDVGIGTNAPTTKVDVDGNIRTNGLFINSGTISNSTTLASGDNAMSAGPVTVGPGVVITLDPNARWVVV